MFRESLRSIAVVRFVRKQTIKDKVFKMLNSRRLTHRADRWYIISARSMQPSATL